MAQATATEMTVGDQTKISWTDATWNPVRGCSKVNSGCKYCYAERVASRFSGPGQPYEGLARNGKWTGRVRCLPEALSIPLHWKRPRRIFVNSMSDLFHPGIHNEFITAVFGVMAACPHHTFQVLTKRPTRMREWFESRDADRVFDWVLEHPADCGEYPNNHKWTWPLPNVWMGVSAEDQATADERIPDLLATSAAVKFVSYEPALGPVDLGKVPGFNRVNTDLSGWWVIMGGESGPGARPMHPDWARSVRDQCVAAGLPFFFKQWGEWSAFYDRDKDDPEWDNLPNIQKRVERYVNTKGGFGFHGDRVVAMRRVGKQNAGHLLDGVEWHQWPKAKS